MSREHDSPGWSANKQIRVDGVIFLHDIGEGKMKGSTLKTLDVIGKLCGAENFANIMFVTTKWDDVKRADVAEAKQEELRIHYFREFVKRGAMLERHDNTCDSAWKLLARLMVKPGFTLQVQRQMADEKKSLEDTDAGTSVGMGSKAKAKPAVQSKSNGVAHEGDTEHDPKASRKARREKGEQPSPASTGPQNTKEYLKSVVSHVNSTARSIHVLLTD